MTNAKLYPLDWETTEIKLQKGKFSHTLRRPTAELILEREKELQTEIPIGRNNEYSLPDPTATEEIDAKYFDKIVVESKGYPGDVPQLHKAAAFVGLYQRDVNVEEGCDIFGDEIYVREEIGGSDEPEFVVTHVLRPPTEDELRKFRGRSTGDIKPGKRGTQIFVTKSNLRQAMQLYSVLFIRLDGATAEGEDLQSFVDPLIQRQVINALVDAFAGSLLD